jgi:hypothetical protein
VLHGAIESDEKLAADLAGSGCHIYRSNLLVLESKADMQKRGQSSPDDGAGAGVDVRATRGAGRSRREVEEEGFGRYTGSSSSGWMR